MKVPTWRFQENARRFAIHKWVVDYCDICGYNKGFVFDIDKVSYDLGCFCNLNPRMVESSWRSVAQYFNVQRNKETIKRMKRFWHFN